MPTIHFTDASGETRSVEAQVGHSLMETARNADIPGIVAECGGMCACATCHVYVAHEWLSKLTPPSDSEEPLLDFIDERQENSRLSCQIPITEELDGLEVTTPESQG